MKLTIEASDQVTRIGGCECRVWHGVSEGGVPCKLFVHRIAVIAEADSSEFDRELQEQMPPPVFVDLRHVL